MDGMYIYSCAIVQRMCLLKICGQNALNLFIMPACLPLLTMMMMITTTAAAALWEQTSRWE